MNFEGINFSNKNKIMNIMKAIELKDLPALYSALRESSEDLRVSFIAFLILNPIRGWNKAVQILSAPRDSMNAVRTAAVCLLMTRVAQEQDQNV